MVMKKLFFLILAIVCSVVIANAQNTSGASKVALKNGIVIEGTVTTQGDDIIVTTANGDMFFYSRSEISSITAPRDSNVSRVESSSPSLSFREYKRAAKAAWRDVKKLSFGETIPLLWTTIMDTEREKDLARFSAVPERQ